MAGLVKFNSRLLLGIFLVSLGCSSSLPSRDLSKGNEKGLEEVRSQLQESKKMLAQMRALNSENIAMLEETRKAIVRAEIARKGCADDLAKAKRTRCRPQACPPCNVPDPVAAPDRKPTSSAPVSEYSESDRPIK